jgi:[acyl-carrier-protein] S-malonyltransferase
MDTSAQKKWLAVFPGQGAQHVGMAKSLHEQFKVVRETFEEASDAIKKDLRKLCFDGPESDLVLTENTQPALLTASVASFRVAQTELGFRPALVAGHSLGEYSALVAAGALPLSTAAAWVRERGAAMQKAVPAGQGTMAAVLNLDDAKIDALCTQATQAARAKRATGEASELTVEAIVQPANFNSPGQIVIAGSTDAVAEAISLIKAGGDFAGAKALPLQVSAPFHCSLMKPAREKMAELFRANPKVSALLCDYIPNRTARVTRESGVVLELLVEQVDHPVLWRQSMTAALSLGFKHGIEFGPGKVLQGLMKRIASNAGLEFSLSGLAEADGVSALETQLKA